MLTLKQKLSEYRSNVNVVSITHLTDWHPGQWINKFLQLEQELTSTRKESYDSADRLIFVFDTTDYSSATFKNFFKQFIKVLNQVDISTFFVVILVNDGTDQISQYFRDYSSDPVPPTIDYYASNRIKKDTTADTFCVIPWIHLMASPFQDIQTCCVAAQSIGRANKDSLRDVWFGDNINEIRQYLLNGDYHMNCAKCYEFEGAGIRSSRQLLNEKFKHCESSIKENPTAVVNEFKLKYIDMRFTNLCNIRCRTCNHHSSSKWYQDEVKLNPEYNKPVIMKAGKTDTDLWEQLEPHLDYVEQIYFAGGEPLIMDEHYKILDALISRGRTDVKLFYNTNFLQTSLKNHNVFDYWKLFKNIKVLASLDAMGARAEYIRKDTIWETIEKNRLTMIEQCPHVGFSICPTVSILNVWHLTDFHRNWVEQQLININDININYLQSPHYYRIDIATPEYKNLVEEKVLKHCKWLAKFPDHQSAVDQYMSLIKFMTNIDNSGYLEEFWKITLRLDQIRNESVLDVLPELKKLCR